MADFWKTKYDQQGNEIGLRETASGLLVWIDGQQAFHIPGETEKNFSVDLLDKKPKSDRKGKESDDGNPIA